MDKNNEENECVEKGKQFKEAYYLDSIMTTGKYKEKLENVDQTCLIFNLIKAVSKPKMYFVVRKKRKLIETVTKMI